MTLLKEFIYVLIRFQKKNKKWKDLKNNQSTSEAPFKILNLGNGKRIPLKKYIHLIERNLNKKAKIKYLGFQPGDIKDSVANIKDTQKYLKFTPKIKVENGVKKFIKWYLSYHKTNIQ